MVDSTIKLGEFEDLSKVEKFEMKEDDYAKRTGKYEMKKTVLS